MHVTQRYIWPVSIHCGRHSPLEPVASCYMSHQCQHMGLFQTRTEDAPVSMRGCLVADDNNSEELLCRGTIVKATIREPTDLGTDSGLVPVSVDRDRYRSNGRPVTDLCQLSML